MSKNATYAVVAPGTHTFRIRYRLRNTTDNPGGAIEGTVSKIVTLNCTAGSIHDVTANLNPHDYDGNHYYMWDAQEQYWKGHEWNLGGSQPTISQGFTGATTSNDYAKSNADSRWYNGSYPGRGISNPAIHTPCKDLPNANEMTWYCKYGEPRWDADELWTTMGHLYKGGMWFKKKANISGFDANKAVDGSDWRTNGNGNYWSVSQTLPDAADANNYFYLPALGCNNIGYLSSVGLTGYYWLSNTDPNYSNTACSLGFSSGGVMVGYNSRYLGCRVEPTFE